MENKEALVKGYSRSAPIYDRTAGIGYLQALRVLLPQVSLGPSPAILDIGCGTGINLLELSRVLGPCRRLVGIDLSSGMVEESRRKAAAAGIQASFVHGDVEAIALDGEGFDLIVCNSVYHWFSNRNATMIKLAGLLKPSGQILIHGVAEPGFYEWRDVVVEMWSRLCPSAVGEPWFPAFPPPEELVRDLRTADLVIEHLKYDLASALILINDIPEFVKAMTVMSPNWLCGAREESVPSVVTAMTEIMVERFPAGFLCTTATVDAVARKTRSSVD